jgi:AmmeMemoRadiSam system protein B
MPWIFNSKGEYSMLRKAYVAGYFYPERKEALEAELASRLNPAADKCPATAIISPHAGYIYSGNVAGAVYSSIVIPNKVILLGPSHRPISSCFALWRSGSWNTPLGSVPIDTDLSDCLLEKSSLISDDSHAHDQEHALEVQLPFLKYLNPLLTIVPIATTYFADFSDLQELGEAVAEAVRDSKESVLIVASTDMSHQEDQETARKKDYQAIDRIQKLDPAGLYETVRSQNISMCGYQATTAVLVASRALGAQKADLIRYQTSGDVTGDYDSVVGYAGLRIL